MLFIYFVTPNPRHGTLALDMEPSTLDPRPSTLDEKIASRQYNVCTHIRGTQKRGMKRLNISYNFVSDFAEFSLYKVWKSLCLIQVSYRFI